jgi:hypothetical protein
MCNVRPSPEVPALARIQTTGNCSKFGLVGQSLILVNGTRLSIVFHGSSFGSGMTLVTVDSIGP